jgi:hypothetical protein
MLDALLSLGSLTGEKRKRACMNVSLELLQHVAKGVDFLQKIMTGNES